MLTVAYLANEFPSAVEPYVSDEMEALRRRGVRVFPGSVRTPRDRAAGIVVQSLSIWTLIQAAWLCLAKHSRIASLLARIFSQGRESWVVRVKALAHTFLGACYAVMLSGREVDHIHVHHGYFGSWIAMTAARLLDVGFSMTLHGSDLLVNGSYLDVKLANCRFCLTVSEYNRNYILRRYPEIDLRKVVVARLGVDVPQEMVRGAVQDSREPFTLLSVGRLHPVKDHAFLVRACAELHSRNFEFRCHIAGDGPERSHLQQLIDAFGLTDCVHLLGHIEREQMSHLYEEADVVVLTSRSEGIPLVLMEAMARGKIVVAPAITGIPELVLSGQNGFLYEPGSICGFLAQILVIRSLLNPERARVHAGGGQLEMIRQSAVMQVRQHFEKSKNLQKFCTLFLNHTSKKTGEISHESSVLQQIQPSF